ncbi:MULTISPECIES: hypothetical protein [Acinetobacter]|uniref:Uncharacterized protein n=1 Tax=Acinetobacter piscicola TaxID=2006115 RepID=A0A7S6VZD6_9GAMM|nr:MULTISPECIES: hypothetical protein [Acinetobacter]QOW47698.1 hypothetical protein G0028_18475 [Acinetobacter piscicola]
MKISKVILFTSVLAMTTSVFADDFISANGAKLTVGDSLKSVTTKLGKPIEQAEDLTIWKLKNGNRIAAHFGEYGLSNVTLSGKNATDYLSTDGVKVFLNKESINTIEKKLKYGCYHEGWGEGAIADYVVRSGPEGSINLIFNTWGGDITTQQLKNQKVTALSLGGDEPFGEEKYCRYPN